MAPLLARRLVFGEVPHVTDLIIGGAVLWLTISILSRLFGPKKKNMPPLVPGGWPLLGNALQLPADNLHRKFTKWAETYGDIYRIKIGSTTNVVLSSPELAREALSTKFMSISTRKTTTAGRILSRNKSMMTGADYGEEHRLMRKLAVTHLLGTKPQAENRPIRDKALCAVLDRLRAEVKGRESAVIDMRKTLKEHVFSFSLQQVFGYVPEGVHVPELGRWVDKDTMFEWMIVDFIKGATIMDWRDLFPALSWIPNKTLEDRIYEIEHHRTWVTNALIDEQRKLLKTRAPTKCYADIILTNPDAKALNPAQSSMVVWEEIFAGTDTTVATSEWIVYRLSIHQKIQDRLYLEIKSVVGDRMVTEDDLEQLPLLTAILQETLRIYAPVPILLPRFVHEDITLGGYDVPKGTQIMMNIYGVNTNPNVWSDPGKWDPDRFLDDKPIVNDIGIKDFRIASFGGGKRLCPGMLQAHYMIRMFVAGLVQKYELYAPPINFDTQNDHKESTFITTHKANALKVLLKPRMRDSYQ